MFSQTCGSEGYTLHYCTCGDSYKTDVKPATDRHDFASEKTGGYRCRVCGLPVIAHGNADGSISGNTSVKYYVRGNLATHDASEIVIYGYGDMPSFSSSNPPPWDRYLDRVERIRLANGVSSIGTHAFYCPDSLVTCQFSMPDSVRRIESFAISLKIPRLVLGRGVETIESTFEGVGAIYLPKSIKRLSTSAFLSMTTGGGAATKACFYEGSLDELYKIQLTQTLQSQSLLAFVETLDDWMIASMHIYVEAEDISDHDHYWRQDSSTPSETPPSETTPPTHSHEYVDGVCRLCGAYKESEGLEFTEINSGYAVSGIGTCRDETLVIPSTYNGRPVTEIASHALYFSFTADRQPRVLVIPDSIKRIRCYALSTQKFITIIVGKNAVFEEYSIQAYGGCEILYSSENGVPSIAISGYTDQNAPYVIRKSTQSSSVITEDGFVFIKAGSVSYLCDYVGSAKDIVLPANFNGSDYAIAPYCFYKSEITSLVIGNGVTKIGDFAFYATPLSTIDLNGKFSELPGFCFVECKQLESLTITENITAIRSQCFDASGIKTMTIGKNVQTIEGSAFINCKNLDTLYYNAINCTEILGSLKGFKKVIIGASVEKIPRYFMSWNYALESIEFEENSSCHTIASDAFGGTSITEISLPTSLKQISTAFLDCRKLEKIHILCENLRANDTVFQKCGADGEGIAIIVSPDVTVLPSNFLEDCKIKSLSFEGESKCKTIYLGFADSLLSNVTIPASVESFDPRLFDLKTLSIAQDSENFIIKNACLIDVKNAKLIGVVDESYSIPPEVTTIAENAFYGSGVKNIYIPDTVLTMEAGSLHCESVESVSLPFIGTDRSTPTMLIVLFGLNYESGWFEVYRYYVPPTFSKLTVRDTTISNGLVGLSMLTEIRISASVESISQTAFQNCTRLSAIYFGGTEEQWNNLKSSGWLNYVSMSVELVLNADIDQ